MINLKLIAIAAAISVSVLSSWWLTAEYKDNKWEAAISKQKVEAASKLLAATIRATEAERAHNELANKLEVEHVTESQNLDTVFDDNRSLAQYGMRDPGYRPSCGVTLSTNTAPPGGFESVAAPANLSNEAAEFLLDLTREADRAAQYARTCDRWIKQLNKNKGD